MQYYSMYTNNAGYYGMIGMRILPFKFDKVYSILYLPTLLAH